MSEPSSEARDLERLLRFLYLCPVGLADFSATGEVRMMNALGVQLLIPLARDGLVDNLFQVLGCVAPDLPQLVADYTSSTGPVLKDRLLRVTVGGAPRHYSLSILRLEIDTYMATVQDVTQSVILEETARDALQAQAVQEGRVEVLTSVLHDIGNGFTGIGTRTAILGASPPWEELALLTKLGGFLRQRRTQLEPALGVDKTAALLGFVDTVGTRLQERAKDWRETLSFFARSISHVQEIINIQRQFIRGGGGAACGPIIVTELLDDALAIQRAALEKRGVAIELDYARDLPRMEADRTRLIQVFINVLRNAVQAFDAMEGSPETGQGRSLKIAVNPAPEGMLEITFADNACGFSAPEGQLAIARGSTTKAGGSGIGLHASAQIIASHHGTLTLRSPGPGLGAVCTLLLPLLPPIPSQAP
jgi:signal transduction histidine kinase